MSSIIPEINWIANGERADSVTLNRPLLEFLAKYETGLFSLDASTNTIKNIDSSIIDSVLVDGDVVSLDTSNGHIVPASQSNIDFILGIIDVTNRKIYTVGTIPNSLVGNLSLNIKYYLDYTPGNEGKLTSLNTSNQLVIGYAFDANPSSSGNELFFIDIGGGIIDADFLNGHNSDYFAKRNGDVTEDFNAHSFKSSNTTVDSIVDSAIVLNGSAGSIVIDDNGSKRISWNDGTGNFNLREGHYTVSNVDKYVGNNGASCITMNGDGTNGSINFKVAVQGTDGDDVIWSTTFVIDTSGASINGNKVLTENSNDYQRNLKNVDSFELNMNGSGDRDAYIDFHSDDTNIDYAARIIRNSGVNGDFDLENVGNGFIRLLSPTYVSCARQSGGLRNLTGTTITPNFKEGNFFYINLDAIGGDVTLNNPINIEAGQSGSFYIKQSSSASYNITFASSYKFPGGTAPFISTTSGALDVVNFEVVTPSVIVCTHTPKFS